MTKKLPIRLRPACKDDIPLIFNSWLKSYRNSLFARFIDNTIFFTEHHKIIEKLLASNDVIVACNQEDPSQVYGYICAGKVDGFFVLHYIYVKHTYRNMGIGRELLNWFSHDPSTASIYTHHTRTAERLCGKFNFIYHPYLIFNLEENDNEQEQES